jgi:hypothetical protein
VAPVGGAFLMSRRRRGNLKRPTMDRLSAMDKIPKLVSSPCLPAPRSNKSGRTVPPLRRHTIEADVVSAQGGAFSQLEEVNQ